MSQELQARGSTHQERARGALQCREQLGGTSSPTTAVRINGMETPSLSDSLSLAAGVCGQSRLRKREKEGFKLYQRAGRARGTESVFFPRSFQQAALLDRLSLSNPTLPVTEKDGDVPF